MDGFVVPGHGLVLPGHHGTPGNARAQARQWLLEHGAGGWDAEQSTDAAVCGRAWWGGDDIGFVQAGHDLAQPVTVVHLPARLVEAG